MNRRLMFLLGAVLSWSVLAAGGAAADVWPQWRGPESNGVAAAGDYPVKFSGDENCQWKIALPGLGMSTPAVWDDRIIVTCGIDGRDAVVAYDFTGAEKWRRILAEERSGKHQHGSGSNPSPVTDGKRVVAYFKSGTLACFDLDGEPQWQVNIQDEHGPDTLWWDLGSSPVLAGDRVIVAVMQSGDSYLAAYNLADGKLAWKQARQYERPVESDHSYTTPQAASIDGREVLVTLGADYLTGHDAATGQLLWELGGFNPRDEPNWRVIASPAVGGDLVLAPFGRGRFLAAVRINGNQAAEAWRRGDDERGIGADVPTPVIDRETAYVLSDVGRIEKLELATGRTIWSGELPRNRNKFYASPVLAGGKLYCAREDGMVFVAAAGDAFELLSENDMGEKVIATPVPVRSGLLIRGERHLFRIGGDAQDESSAG